VGTVAALGAVVALLVWPRSDPTPSTRFRVGEIAGAVRVLEARLGGPQRYVGILATPDGVSLLVAEGTDAQVAWFSRAGELQGPGADEPRDRLPDFGLDGVALDKASAIARDVETRFPGSTIEEFALRKLPDAGVVWALTLRSSRGGQIGVTFTPDGQPLGAELR
jgi:hypothetical protein